MIATPIQRCAPAQPGTERLQAKSRTGAAQPARDEHAGLTSLIQRKCASCEEERPRWQAKYAVNQPGDRWEKEADAVATAVASNRPAPSISGVAAEGMASDIRRAVNPAAASALPARTNQSDPVTEAIRHPGPGGQLRPAQRARIESSTGADLGSVRVHTGRNAERAAGALQARAFTSGQHIWLGRGESPDDLALMAHEATHVVQQGGAPQRRAAGALPSEETAGAPRVQRWSWRDLTPDFIEAGIDLVGDAVAFTADLAWSVVRRIAPGLARIIEQVRAKGIVGYLGDVIKDGLSSIFGGLRDQGGALGAMAELFGGLAASAADILSNLARGNCEPLFAAVERLKNAVSQIAGDVWNAITDFFRPVGEFFTGLWEAFDQSVLAWLRQIGSDAWQFIEELGSTIWSYVEPIKDAVIGLGGQIWDWVKDQLGIGGGGGDGESEGGLLAWVQAKAEEAWAGIKELLSPIITPIQGLIQSVRDILPLDAILNLRETISEWLNNVTQTATAMQADDGVAENQGSLRETILPAVIASIGRLRRGVLGAGSWIADKVNAVAGAVTGFLGSVAGNPLLGFAAGALSWLQDRVNGLAGTITGAVGNVFNFVAEGLALFQRFLEPILRVLVELVSLVGDLIGRLVSFVTGALWGWIPECIRRPIQDFIVNQILRRIPIFSQLLDIPDLWARLQRTAMRILRQVFVNGDLLGAAWTFFSSLLDALGLPSRLVLNIVAKAARAIGDIITNPIGFFINLLRSVKAGFERFFGNIWTNLFTGFANWLFGALDDLGVTPPRDFSLPSILGLVLQILGLSLERIFQKLERHPRVGAAVARRLRQTLELATGVWQFVAILINEGPAGLWRELMSRLSNLWVMVRDAAINWIMQRVMAEATQWLLAMLDISGIMPVVRSLIAIYRAIESAIQYLRQMLEVVERVLDGVLEIARGVIDTAAQFLENGLVRALPVAIGFLANQLGLGSLPRRLGEIIVGVRGRVDSALDWLIERAVTAGQAVLNTLRSGAQAAAGAVAGWLGLRREFTAGGQSHRLYFRGSNATAQLTVESTPQTLESFLPAAEALPQNASKGAIFSEIRQKQARIRELQALSSPTPQQNTELEETFARISVLLAQIVFPESTTGGCAANPNPPPTQVTWTGSNVGEQVVARPLTRVPGTTTGSIAQDVLPAWSCMPADEARRYWVRAHLLHGRTSSSGATNLHGPGNQPWNLIIADKTLNGAMSREAEQPAISRVYRDNHILYYRVSARPEAASGYKRFFARSITVTWGCHDPATGRDGPPEVSREFTGERPVPPSCT